MADLDGILHDHHLDAILSERQHERLRVALADLLASERAAAATAAAVGACCAAAEALREGPHTPTIGALVESMRRASPAGLVAVSVDEVRHALGTCGCKVVMNGSGLNRSIRAAWPEAHTAAVDNVRAAVARGEG